MPSYSNSYRSHSTQPGPWETFVDALFRERGVTGQQGDQSQETRSGFMGLLNEDPSKVLSSYVDSAMPQFNKELQGVREKAISRGISTGDLGTSYEGDLASAFHRNIAGKAGELYSTRLGAYGNLAESDADRFERGRERDLSGFGDLLSMEQAVKSARRNRRAGLLGAGIGALGSIGGAAAGR